MNKVDADARGIKEGDLIEGYQMVEVKPKL